MKKKKLAALTLPCVLALTVLTACGHSHSAAGGWELNAKEHWQVCECGEAVDPAAHTLAEESVCTVCGAEIWNYGSMVDVYTYTEYGDLLRLTTYDADGGVIDDLRFEYEYDADGNKLLEKDYKNGVLLTESVYESGVLLRNTDYYEDGTKGVSEYDETGNVVSAISYSADGTVETEVYSEYAARPDGERYESKNTVISADGTKYVGEYNEYGDQTAWFFYDAAGSLESGERYEYEYDAEGRIETQKTYVDGVLTQELHYVTVTEDSGWMSYPAAVIDYHADGSKTVSEYDENDDLVSETVYDAAGNVVA